MGLKEELDKIVNAERRKLDMHKAATRDFHEGEKRRFAVLANLLRELSQTLDDRYGTILIEDDSAEIRMGGHHARDLVITVRPACKTVTSNPLTFGAAEGFWITEKAMWPEYRKEESMETLSTEQAVIEYLLKKIGKQIAHYQRRDELK